jgi:ATP-dependent Lhr-like helicase
MSTFARFPPRLQDAIASRLGWTSLRPVQEEAGEAILAGKNVVVLAPTAGGKTEAAMFPVIAGLMAQQPEGVGALYIAPIKALLNNQDERLGTYTEMVGLRRFVWHGDAKDGDKRRFVKEPAELLMTTPESLEVMLLSPRVPTPQVFAALQTVVIDEIHALAGTDRGAHLMSVLERLLSFTPNDVQRIGLSATVGNPAEILTWLTGTSKRPGAVIDPLRPPAPRQITIGLYQGPSAMAEVAARDSVGKKSLFFCQSRATSESVAERMRGRGVDVFVHHSSVSLDERREAEERFQRGTNACIVCTSTLELGIDVGDLDLVFQANAPSTVSSFLQRMGRTGRRPGQMPNTAFLCETPEDVLQAVAIVELANAGWVESVTVDPRCWPVLVHQLLALTLQHGAVSAERCWEQLSRVPDFSGVRREEFDALVTFMRQEDFLFEAGGLLSMGTRAERVYGRKNFSELYAVFSSPVLYHVETAAGRALGSLEQTFVDRLVVDMSSFLLAGRAWTVESVNHTDRRVRVREAPRGQRPSWGGFLPQLLGHGICQRMRRVLTEEVAYPYLAPDAANVLEALRSDVGALLRRSGPIATQVDDGGVGRLWTYAGGRINHTLKYGIEWSTGWKAIADNFLIRVEGQGITHATLTETLDRLATPEFWEAPANQAAIVARLPEYRLSKFQQALPESMAIETVGGYLLSFKETGAFLRSKSSSSL